jgi:hypothetical protein
MSEPYEDRSDEAWAGRVAATFDWKPLDEGWIYQGKCPRCDHAMYKSLTTVLYSDALRSAPMTLVVACNCDMPHEGRPDGRQGCGVYGGIQIEQ